MGDNILRNTDLYPISGMGYWSEGEWFIDNSNGTVVIIDVNDSPSPGITKGFSVQTTSNNYLDQRQLPLEVGKTYTFSAWRRVSADSTVSNPNCRVGIYITDPTTGHGNYPDFLVDGRITNTNWERFTQTFTVTDIGTRATSVNGVISGGNVDFCGLKLEEGSTATAWSPAPEDIVGNPINAVSLITDPCTKNELVETVNDNHIRGVEYIRGVWRAASGEWTGVTQDTELYDGKQIILYMPFAGYGNATLNLTLADGTQTGAKNVYFESTTRFTTHKPQNAQLPLIYHKAQRLSDGNVYEGWWYLANRDLNDTANNLRYNVSTFISSTVMYRYQLMLQKNETTLIPLTTENNKPSLTTKTLTQEEFDPFGLIAYYSSTSTVNANAAITASTIYYQIALDLRYSSNVGQTLTEQKDIYLVAVPQSNGKAKLHSTPFVQDLPTTDDGLLYIYLGRAYSTYQIVLAYRHPIYIYKNGHVCEYSGYSDIAGNVTGTVAIANGGTGLTASPSMLTNLGSTTAANVLQASPRPGVTGTLGAAHGGTGQTSLINSANALINALDTGSNPPVDNDYFISQYVGGGTTTLSYYRRPISKLWDYIKNKIASAKLVLAANMNGDDNTSGALDLANSNILNVNSIYTADASDNAKEGIHFYRTATTVDSIHASSGKLYFTPNRTLGENGEPQEIYSMLNYQNGTTDISVRPYVDRCRANRLAFLPADQIIIEQTTDGGTTWVDAGVSDATKTKLFAGVIINIGIPLLNGERSTQCGLRITITGMKYNVPDGTAETGKYAYWNSTYVNRQERYFNVREWWFWVSAATDTIRCQIEASTGANPNTWVSYFDKDFGLTGYSGSDWIRAGNGQTFGGGTNQTGNKWNWRLTFWSRMKDGESAFTGTSAQTIYNIRCYGDNVWGMPVPLGSNDHLYSFDENQNATFPAKVTATGGFVGDVTGGSQWLISNPSNRPASANVMHDNNKRVIAFLASSNMTTGKPPADAHMLHFNWDNGNGTAGTYDAQLALTSNSHKIYFRSQASGTWSDWYRVYHEGDKQESVTGNAGSADKLNTDAGSGLNPVYFSNGVPVASKGNSIPFVVGTGSTAGTWLGTLDGVTAYYDGLLILYKPSVAGASTTTLNLNNLGAKTCYVNNATKLTTHFPANQPILLAYSTSQNSGCWMCIDNYWTNTIPQAQCDTAAATAAKTATMTSYSTTNTKSHLMVNVRYTNTSATALTLNINSQGAKPVYINGTASSTTNHTLPAGSYLVYYDGTNYYFRTDGMITGSVTGTASKLSNLFAIDGNYTDGSSSVDHFATCSTAADTATKVVKSGDPTFITATGARIAVKFTVTNTAAVNTLKLKVGMDSAAYPIKYRGSNLITAGTLSANRVYEFVFDGTNWEIVGDLDTNTEYPAGSSSDLSDGSNTSSHVWSPKTLHDYIDLKTASCDLLDNGTIDGVYFFDALSSDYSLTHYGVCDTSDSTAAKTVDIEGFTAEVGARAIVRFTGGNTVEDPTLNVSGSGAYPIYHNGAAIPRDYIAIRGTYEFVFNGSQYDLIGDGSSGGTSTQMCWYATSSTAAGTAAKTATCSGYFIGLAGHIVNVSFSTANTVAGALTLNVNSQGAKTIYVNGAATSTTNCLLWNAGEILTFVYNGSNYMCIGQSGTSVQEQNPVFTNPTVYDSRCTIVSGGYYREGKHVYVNVRVRIASSYAGQAAGNLLSGFPTQLGGAVALASYETGTANTVVVGFVSDGYLAFRVKSGSATTSSTEIVFTGTYIAS